MHLPNISIIVPCHNDTQWLPRMLESVAQQTARDRIDIILVNVCSDWEHTQKIYEIAKQTPRCQVVQQWDNHGYGAACNFGVMWSRADIFYFINSDCWFEPDAIELLSQRAYRGGVGLTCGTFCEYDSVMVQSRPYSGFDIFGNSCGHTSRIFSQVGFAMMPRQAFERVGGFDPEHFMYGEEEDMSWRVWACGYSVEFVREAVIHHRNSQLEYRATNRSRFLIARNCLLRLCKNADTLLLLLLFPASLLVLMEACIGGLMNGWPTFKAIGIDPFISIFRLRYHIWRRRGRTQRIHGDFWMLRFFRLGFGRMEDVRKVFKLGLPKLT